MSVSDCCWHWQDTVLAAGCQQVLSICLLPIPRTPQSTCCEMRFIQLVTLLLFFVTKYRTLIHTLQTSAVAKTLTSPCLHWAIPPSLSMRMSFMDDPKGSSLEDLWGIQHNLESSLKKHAS